MEFVVSFFMAQGLATVVPEPFSPVSVAFQPALTSRHRDAGVPDSGKLKGATGKRIWMGRRSIFTLCWEDGSGAVNRAPARSEYGRFPALLRSMQMLKTFLLRRPAPFSQLCFGAFCWGRARPPFPAFPLPVHARLVVDNALTQSQPRTLAFVRALRT